MKLWEGLNSMSGKFLPLFLYLIIQILALLMALKFLSRIFWIMIFTKGISQENIWENAEEFIQTHYEPDE